MNVAFDATPLTVPTGGIGRYTAELSRAMAETFREDRFWLVSDREFPMPPAPENLVRGRAPQGWLARRWWLWGLSRELSRIDAQVFHGTDFAVPYLPLRPSVLTLHDLSPWMASGWHANAERVRQRTPFLLGLGIATMVLTDSAAVRRQAIEQFRLAAARVAAVPLAASKHFRPVAVPQPSVPYFLYVGTLEPRKNIETLVAAWREVRRVHTVDLVLAGRRREDAPALAEEAGLRITGAAPEADLPALYSGALACVYPSFYEGFGLPVLEAMQCGALVITSRDAAVREVGGEAAVAVEARDVRGWVDAMMAAAANPEWVEERRLRSRERARHFSWTRTAQLTREVYDEARRRFGR